MMLLYSVLCGSSYGNHGQGRAVYVWCIRRFAVLEVNADPLGHSTQWDLCDILLGATIAAREAWRVVTR
jgi:hypothetical protein